MDSVGSSGWSIKIMTFARGHNQVAEPGTNIEQSTVLERLRGLVQLYGAGEPWVFLPATLPPLKKGTYETTLQLYPSSNSSIHTVGVVCGFSLYKVT